MLENGADIRLIQQFLGHSELNTTALYAQVAITQLQAVYEQSHPSQTGLGNSDSKKKEKAVS